MNISEQLNLLKNIKNSIKNRLIERKADIDDTTPFSQYANCILTIDRIVYTDKSNGSTNRKDKTSIFASDNFDNSSHIKEKTSIIAFDRYLDSSHVKEISSLRITDFSESYKIYSNPPMTANSMNGWTASACHANSGNEAYKGFNKDMTGENCWWTGTGLNLRCWLALSFDTLYKIRSVEIVNENASPENFRNALIQFRTDSNAQWETLYEIVNRPNITGYSEEYIINSNTSFKEFRLYITSSHSSTVSIQNININFK